MTPPRPAFRSVLLAKRGSAPRECEDALAVSGDGLAFAVCDGATEGLDSRRWARSLTRAWTARGPRRASVEDLAACARTMGDRTAARWQGRTVPWYLEEKAALGAFAAFVGVELGADGRVEATAIGDCCLFLDDGGAVAASFPAASAAEFGARPTLLPSNHARFGDFVPHVRRTTWAWPRGARLVLLSDAIAAWWFEEHERGGARIREIHAALDAADSEAVALVVAQERDARRMRNDDVAILRAERPRS